MLVPKLNNTPTTSSESAASDYSVNVRIYY